jgi:hypothetical protein
VEAWPDAEDFTLRRWYGDSVPESFAGWALACGSGSDWSWIAPRILFENQGCADLDESLFGGATPLGFFPLPGGLTVVRRIDYAISRGYEIVVIGDHGERVLFERGFGGD